MFKANYWFKFSANQQPVVLKAIDAVTAEYRRHGQSDKIHHLRKRVSAGEKFTDLDHPLVDEVLFGAAHVLEKADLDTAKRIKALEDHLWEVTKPNRP